MRKIVSIGGGQYARTDNDGRHIPAETLKIDREIVKLTGKENPHFLALAHSTESEKDAEIFLSQMTDIYKGILGCECRLLPRSLLSNDMKSAEELIEWADIIYERGGDTKGMMEYWKKTGFDARLRSALDSGKVLCGLSAGAICWYNSFSSGSLRAVDKNAPLIAVDGLSFVDAFIAPHCTRNGKNSDRLEHMREHLKGSEMIGIGLSDCAAIEIVGDEYRILTGEPYGAAFSPFAVRIYYDGDICHEDMIEPSDNRRPLSELIFR